MSELIFALTPSTWRDGNDYWLPKIDLSIGGVSFAAVVDTGASVTTVDKSVLEMLGYTEDEIRAQPEVFLGGVGGSQQGWLHELDLHLGAILLRDVPCVVAPDQTDLVLLGQQLALNLLVFIQDGPERTGRLEFR